MADTLAALFGAPGGDTVPPRMRCAAAAVAGFDWSELLDELASDPHGSSVAAATVLELQRFLLLKAADPDAEYGPPPALASAWRVLILLSVSHYVSLWAALGFDAALDCAHAASPATLSAARSAYAAVFGAEPPSAVWETPPQLQEEGAQPQQPQP